MISSHMKNRLIMPYITSAEVLSAVWLFDIGVWIVREFADHLISLSNLTLPSAGSCSLPVGRRLIDWRIFTDRGEDGRVTEGVLFRGTHNLALEAVNKCKSWRHRGKKIKTLHLPPGPEKGEFCISPCPEFQNWLLQEILLLCWGLYWCHTLPPLPSNEWN